MNFANPAVDRKTTDIKPKFAKQIAKKTRISRKKIELFPAKISYYRAKYVNFRPGNPKTDPASPGWKEDRA